MVVACPSHRSRAHDRPCLADGLHPRRVLRQRPRVALCDGREPPRSLTPDGAEPMRYLTIFVVLAAITGALLAFRNLSWHPADAGLAPQQVGERTNPEAARAIDA